jgi:hypothetical protein
MTQLDILFVSCTFIVSPKTFYNKVPDNHMKFTCLAYHMKSTCLVYHTIKHHMASTVSDKVFPVKVPNKITGKVKVPKKTLAYLKRRYHYYSKDPSICYQLYVDELFFCPLIDPENILSDINAIELSYFRFKRECYQMVVGKTKDEIQCWLISFFPIAKWEWEWFSYIKDNDISIRDVKLVFYTHYIMQLRTYNTLRHIFNSKKIKNKNDLYAFLNEPFNIRKNSYKANKKQTRVPGTRVFAPLPIKSNYFPKDLKAISPEIISIAKEIESIRNKIIFNNNALHQDLEYNADVHNSTVSIAEEIESISKRISALAEALESDSAAIPAPFPVINKERHLGPIVQSQCNNGVNGGLYLPHSQFSELHPTPFPVINKERHGGPTTSTFGIMKKEAPVKKKEN